VPGSKSKANRRVPNWLEACSLAIVFSELWIEAWDMLGVKTVTLAPRLPPVGGGGVPPPPPVPAVPLVKAVNSAMDHHWVVDPAVIRTRMY
jgi:hypothetical protein